MAYESGFKTTLAVKMSAGDATMYVATAPTTTAGRVFIKNGQTKEWFSFAGTAATTPPSLTGCVRQLSTTADPSTSLGSGYDFLAGTSLKIVAMHDQIPDTKGTNTFSGTNNFTGTMNFTNVGDLNVNGKSNPTPEVADTTARDAMYPSPVTGDMAYVDSLNALQIYNTGLASRQTMNTGTTVNDASTTVKGIAEEATVAEVGAQTATGGTGARLFINPTATKKTSAGAGDENKIPVLDANGQLATGFINGPGVQTYKLTDYTFLAGEDIVAGNSLYLNISDNKLYKTKGDDVTKLPDIPRIATANASSGAIVYYDYMGFTKAIAGLTVNSVYFISNTAGAISTTPGTYPVYVGYTNDNTGVLNLDQTPVSAGSITTAATTIQVATLPTERASPTNNTPTKLKSFVVTKIGYYYITWLMRRQAGGTNVYSRIYKNGVAFGTEKTTASAVNVAQTEASLLFNKGDTVQLYAYGDGTGSASYVSALLAYCIPFQAIGLVD